MNHSLDLKITILGSGTSTGVPLPGCGCAVCISSDTRNNRLRTSAMITYQGKNILFDVGPDFRQQMLRHTVQSVDAVLFTHSHADHIMGIDDLRPYYFKQKKPIHCYGDEETLSQIRRIFYYIFDRDPRYQGGGIGELLLEPISQYDPFSVAGLSIQPFPLVHGHLTVLGFKIGNFAYATDCKTIPEFSRSLLQGIDTLVLDGLREEDHRTHMTIQQAITCGRDLGVKRLILTHLGHSVDYQATTAKLPEGVELAYDGMSVVVV